MISIKRPSGRRMTPPEPSSPRLATIQRITEEPIIMIISINSKLPGVMVPKIATGRPRTIQILKILLPIMLPTRSSFSWRLAAVMVVTSSGREVPNATIVRAIMRSETPIIVARVEAELTTSWLPATMPARPKRTRRKEGPSLYLGFSMAFLSLRFCLTMPRI